MNLIRSFQTRKAARVRRKVEQSILETAYAARVREVFGDNLPPGTFLVFSPESSPDVYLSREDINALFADLLVVPPSE